jgi:hypothetical protein
MRRSIPCFLPRTIAAVLLSGGFCLLQANVIFSNVVGTDVPPSGAGISIGPGAYAAQSFTTPPNNNYSVTGIDIALELPQGTSACLVTVSLMTDSSGLPGVVLESFNLTNLPVFDSNVHPLTSVLSGLFPQLAASTQYWVAVTGCADWIVNVTGDVGPRAAQFGSTPWTILLPSDTKGAFRINGEPASGAVPLGQHLEFVPVTPCRIADTRNPTGAFGGPFIASSSYRDFFITDSACQIPTTAQAYSLNITAVPLGPVGFVSVWPTGNPQPVVSTLNSSDGRIKANAAIVPAGLDGGIRVFSSNPTNVIIDINGYFDLPGGATLAFYPLTPCRIADTRLGTGIFAGPSLGAGVARDFPILSSPCNVPESAQAYALNMTVVPSGPLGFLSAWPTGSPQPGSSTLNAPTGAVTANAAIVPAGSGGAIRVIATNATDLVIDINGYFAPPGGAAALSFFAVTPCRVADTRSASGPFGGPQLSAATPRSFVVPSSSCQIPVAQAYSLNATVVPPAGLGFLTLWGSGPMATVSTLNDSDGTIVANAALVPAAGDGSVSVFASNATDLILDINGYFAQ